MDLYFNLLNQTKSNLKILHCIHTVYLCVPKFHKEDIISPYNIHRLVCLIEAQCGVGTGSWYLPHGKLD